MADGISSTTATMDGVMGAANRAEQTIRSLDTRSFMIGWGMLDRGGMNRGFGVMVEHGQPQLVLDCPWSCKFLLGDFGAMYRTRFFTSEQYP